MAKESLRRAQRAACRDHRRGPRSLSTCPVLCKSCPGPQASHLILPSAHGNSRKRVKNVTPTVCTSKPETWKVWWFSPGTPDRKCPGSPRPGPLLHLPSPLHPCRVLCSTPGFLTPQSTFGTTPLYCLPSCPPHKEQSGVQPVSFKQGPFLQDGCDL